ncbi:leukotriene B4 receptor 1-like [Poecilia reticulata]|uniref:leukotriene B4 receptor 1-like n=1 Tax=Poecilia reticulata TaxID=8081 RepID=UPI0004A43C01|nr:PREDICTED: leukotriene B4 receptor 1-like [Poecilia reticulata]
MEPSNSTSYNLSSSGLLPPPSLQSKGVVPVAVMSFCCFVGVSGNIAVILLKPNWHHLSSLSQSLMLNLAISDLLCLLTLPPWIYPLLYGWSFGLAACKILTYLVYCSIYGSKLTVTVLSVQRYLTVVHQRRFPQVKKRPLLALLWMAAVILAVPALVVRQLPTNQQPIVCQSKYTSTTQGVAVLLAETLFDFCSFALVVFSYFRLHRTVNQAAFFNNPQTTRLVTCIIVSFFVVWTPYHVINVLGVAAMCLNNKRLLKFCKDTWDIVKALTFVNSCLNPLLYAFTSNKMCVVCQKKEEVQSQNLQTTQSPDIGRVLKH